MTAEEKALLERIEAQQREILSLLRGEDDGGLTVALLTSAPDPRAAIREHNRQWKARQKQQKGRAA